MRRRRCSPVYNAGSDSPDADDFLGSPYDRRGDQHYEAYDRGPDSCCSAWCDRADYTDSPTFEDQTAASPDYFASGNVSDIPIKLHQYRGQ